VEIEFLPKAFRAFAPPRTAAVKAEAVHEGESEAARAATGAATTGAAQPS
jgi:hypothetical protein